LQDVPGEFKARECAFAFETPHGNREPLPAS
jgi:hypothetical protein